MDISVGHTPDSDDAFMFYAMFTDKVKSDDFSVTHVIEDIENLNKKAKNPELDVTAVSVHLRLLQFEKPIKSSERYLKHRGSEMIEKDREVITLC